MAMYKWARALLVVVLVKRRIIFLTTVSWSCEALRIRHSLLMIVGARNTRDIWAFLVCAPLFDKFRL